MSVKIDASSVKIRINKIRDTAADSMWKATLKAVNNLNNLSKKAAPADTGELRRKHRTTTKWNGSTIEGRVEAYAEHAVYVHEGTGIYAKNGNGRKTPWGYMVNTNRSKYKGFHLTVGQKSQPWMENTIKDNKDNIKRLYGNVLKGGFKK